MSALSIVPKQDPHDYINFLRHHPRYDAIMSRKDEQGKVSFDDWLDLHSGWTSCPNCAEVRGRMDPVSGKGIEFRKCKCYRNPWRR